MSTLLSDLDSASGPAGDGDLVNQIMREMNMSSGAQGPPPPMPSAPPPPTPANIPPMMAAPPLPPNAVNQHVMDAQPATAHILNGSAPSAGDFHAAGAYGGGGGGAPYMPGGLPAVNPKGYEYPRRSFRQRITEEMKLPILVSLLVFVFSLPVVNFLFAHYLPRMVQPTGQLTSVGLVLKSLAAGAAFWLMQRVVVPLFSM